MKIARAAASAGRVCDKHTRPLLENRLRAAVYHDALRLAEAWLRDSPEPAKNAHRNVGAAVTVHVSSRCGHRERLAFLEVEIDHTHRRRPQLGSPVDEELA